MKPRIFILVPTFWCHDAVGNDVLGMYRVLGAAGYDVRILAGEIHPDRASITSTLSLESDYWRDPRAILIYHHSIDWKLGEKILRRSMNKIVIKYHNVTPPEFFAPYAQNYYQACVDGVAATQRLAGLRIDFVWGASCYNAQEFVRLGVPAGRCRVVPPLHCIEDLGCSPLDTAVMAACRETAPNILFVGAFRPNKGHSKALEVLAAYRRRGAAPARLIFAGSLDPALTPYVDSLRQYARELDVDDGLSFATSVTASQLRSYYTAASVFLCVSEHEGFCVPLVEAMYFRTPIVAWASTAVGETCGGYGMVYEQFNAEQLAEALEECVENPLLSHSLAAKARTRYETAFHPGALQARLLELVDEVARS